MNDLLNAVKINTLKITDYISGVSDAQAIMKPNPETWSIMENMEHLFITEKGIYKLLNRPDLFSDKGSNWTKKIDDYRQNKFIAPDFTLPKGRFSSVEEITNAYKVLRSQLEEYVQNELPNAGNETAPHPLFGPITKTQWIEFTIDHGERHLKQMKGLFEHDF